MKHITYILGLLKIITPNSKAQVKNSAGETVTPKSIHEPMALKTTLPNNVNTWENVTPESCNNWMNEMNISKSYSRFVVTPLSNENIKKQPLVLVNVLER